MTVARLRPCGKDCARARHSARARRRCRVRLACAAVEALMGERPGSTLEAALEVFEVFASGSLSDEIYILDDVAGKRIAIAPTAFREKYRRG